MDQERVAELYAAHVPPMRRLAFMMLGGNEAQSEDIVHDAFIRAAARLPELRDPDRFAAYFRRAVVNGVTSMGRRHRVELRWLQTQAATTTESVQSDALDRLATAAAAAELLAQLPARQRLAVTARVCLDLSEAQTAALLGCSIGTVKSLTSRGLTSLRGITGEHPRERAPADTERL
jgi:RNA polymerase sigma factor (sigma-70 family)